MFAHQYNILFLFLFHSLFTFFNIFASNSIPLLNSAHLLRAPFLLLGENLLTFCPLVSEVQSLWSRRLTSELCSEAPRCTRVKQVISSFVSNWIIISLEGNSRLSCTQAHRHVLFLCVCVCAHCAQGDQILTKQPAAFICMQALCTWSVHAYASHSTWVGRC